MLGLPEDWAWFKSWNRTSIGMEICESGSYTLVRCNSGLLVAKMLRERG